MTQREDTITIKRRGKKTAGAGKTSYYSQKAKLVFHPEHRDLAKQQKNGSDLNGGGGITLLPPARYII